MRRFWKLCVRFKFRRLANAFAYVQASKHGSKMIPVLIPWGLSKYKIPSFVNGFTLIQQIGWISEIDEEGKVI